MINKTNQNHKAKRRLEHFFKKNVVQRQIERKLAQGLRSWIGGCFTVCHIDSKLQHYQQQQQMDQIKGYVRIIGIIIRNLISIYVYTFSIYLLSAMNGAVFFRCQLSTFGWRCFFSLLIRFRYLSFSFHWSTEIFPHLLIFLSSGHILDNTQMHNVNVFEMA